MPQKTKAMNKKNKKNQQGFTLVELIVVLVILAILASLLIPALTGYVTKAKKQAVITEARDVWTASQAALSECYALYPESFTSVNGVNSCRFSITVNGTTYKDVGRITNGALHAIQKNPNDKTEAGSSSRRVAAQVLKYLESDGKNPRYTFGNGATISSAIKPSAYFKSKPKKTDVMIQIFHTKEGRIVAINFAKDGYMATIVPGQETTCEYDGACIASTG